MLLLKYDNRYIFEVNRILTDAPDFLRDDILEGLRAFPQNAQIAYVGLEPAAIGLHAASLTTKKARFVVFVDPRFRRRKVGTYLCRELFKDMKKLGASHAYCDFADDALTEAFVESLGMYCAFHSCLMEYCGSKMDCSIVFEAYRDEMFAQFQALESEAFYDLRKSIGLEPFYIEPCDEYRREMADRPDDFFVYFDGDELVAAGSASAGELDDVAVAKSHRGRGLGKQIVAHAVNKLLDSGAKAVKLWVVQSNDIPYTLYKKLGFEEVRVHSFCLINMKSRDLKRDFAHPL